MFQKIKKSKSLLNNKNIINIFIIIILLFSILFIVSNSMIINKENPKDKLISIEVRGEVDDPGIYEFVLGSTFNDLFKTIKLKNDADISSFNLNSTLSNKQVIIIPKLKENKLISINSASLIELSSLKGIGNSLAQRIIEYRENNNGFKSIEEIKNVKGIGDKKFENIKEYITL